MSNKPRIITGSRAEMQNPGQCDCNCNCACSLVSQINQIDNRFLSYADSIGVTSYQRSDFHTFMLNESYIMCYGLFSRMVLLNRYAFKFLLDIEQSSNLHRIWRNNNLHTILDQMLALGLLVPSNYRVPTLVAKPLILSAWLHITDRCNLRCDYCYLPHARADMLPTTGRAAIDATFRSALAHGYRAVKLKYAGGEPLLRFPFVIELHRYAQSLARQYDLELDGVVLSNGTLLTADMVATMQSVGLRLMISLDGLGNNHDSQRHFPDGRGSFDIVAHAIDLALAGGLVPDISITVSGRNAHGLADVVAWVLERDLPFSLNFYRENTCSMAHTDLRLEEDRIIEGMLSAYKVIESNLPRRSLLSSLVDRANLSAPHLRTCSVGQSYLVFDTQGRVAPCQMAMTQTVTDYNDPDPLATVRNNTGGLQNPKVDEKEECAVCEWRYWCAGGCPLQNYRATGRYDVKSPNCNIYKALYPEVIRLEGLRLLKYADE